MVDAQRTPFDFDREQDFVRERGNQSIDACLPFIYFLSGCFLFFLFLTLISFLFPGISFRIPISQLWFPLLLYFLFTARFSFYSTCRDRILLFYPLISSFWSGCTGRPPLVRLCATPHHQTKKGILFVCLPWHPFLLRYGFFLSLSIPHGMHLVVPTQLASFGQYVIPAGHFPQKILSRNLKNRFFPSPHHQTMPSYF